MGHCGIHLVNFSHRAFLADAGADRDNCEAGQSSVRNRRSVVA